MPAKEERPSRNSGGPSGRRSTPPAGYGITVPAERPESSTVHPDLRRVIVYIDGFNLYNGLKEAYGHKYLWLNLENLSRRLLLDDQQLVAVKYFTAPVRNQPRALRRQQKYWNALRAYTDVEIVVGRFQEKHVVCRACGTTWTSYEEKETDVSIATSLVEDSARQRFDAAVIVSADSDLCPAIRAVKSLHPAATIVAAFPPRRRSDELRKVVTASFTIAHQKLAASLLPDLVTARSGQAYPRPNKWQ